jgi:hypothetical protein
MSRRSSLKLSLLALALPAALTACSSLVGDQEGSGRTSEATSISPADASSILDLVDDPDTDLTLLDVTIKLDSRAAKNIVAARDGKDGVCPSADDAPFTSLSALEAVPYVGDSAIGKLQAYAAAHPAPKSEVVEGVTFLGWQSAAVVWGVNHSSLAQLDAFLDTRAAHALVAGTPFTTVAQMGPLSYVGDKALQALLAHATGWWMAFKAPGFVLDAATLATDAEILKESLPEDEAFGEYLITLGGSHDEATVILQALEHEIDVLTGPLVGTSYASADDAEAAVDAAAPVENLTKEGGWAYLETIGVAPPAAMACVASFEKAVYPHLSALLFMSESDRPFDMVFYPGAGGVPPTAASVLAIVEAAPGSSSELRATSDYFVALEPSGSDATAVQSLFTSQLTDVIYVAVHAPAGSIDTALVDVYLVGRTTCGDLVGLHAIAVET